MKKLYDFSKGERGKFFFKDAEFFIPIYLEPETQSFVEKIAKKNEKDPSTIVNELLKSEMKLAKYFQ